MSTATNPAMNAGVNQRVALVTGGTGGIGRAVARGLARGGDRVLFVGRPHERGAAVLETLCEAQPDAAHAFIQGNLSLLSETARVADEVLRRSGRLDAVVFCAGNLATVPEWTVEGLECTFVLNYLSRYLQARRLLPTLTRAPSGRLILVANAGLYPDTLDFADLQQRHGTRGLHASSRTLFANDPLAVELAERLRETRAEVTCVFPGITNTASLRNARGLPRPLRGLGSRLRQALAASPEEAAQTPLFLAQAAEATGVSRRFYGSKRKERPVPARARRPERRCALWAASEDLVRPYLTGDAPHAPGPPRYTARGAHP